MKGRVVYYKTPPLGCSRKIKNTPLFFFTLTFNNMIEKIINGTYKAKLLKKRLCDVKIIVWGNGEPKTIEQVSYNEYNIIEPYLVKEGE